MESGNSSQEERVSEAPIVGAQSEKEVYIEPPFHNMGRPFDLLESVVVGLAFVRN
jgi:hypothetical protein